MSIFLSNIIFYILFLSHSDKNKGIFNFFLYLIFLLHYKEITIKSIFYDIITNKRFDNHENIN